MGDSGGMELLFGGRRRIDVAVPRCPGEGQVTVQDLLKYIRDFLHPDRPELFMQQDTM
jgi:hypothetical protein